MKKIMLALLGLGLAAGCDFNVPLTTAPELARDPALLGVWQTVGKDEAPQRLLALPLGEKEYLISYPAGTKDAMFGRGALVRAGGKSLLQIEWIGTAQGALPTDRRVFQAADYTVRDGRLVARLLNADTVGRDAATTAELLAAIAAQEQNPQLFREEMAFEKVTAP